MALVEYKNAHFSLLYKPTYRGGNEFNYLTNSLTNIIPKLQPKQKVSSEETKGKQAKIGETIVTITDGFGIRNFKGREGQHSTGIDLITNTGKAVALKDGKIESVKLEGNGLSTDVTNKKGEAISSAGYYVTVKHDDGTKMQYMHLNPMSPEEMKSLQNKSVKKGEVIWGYDIGSGSMTGKHYKVRLFNGASAKDSYIDPTNLLFE